MASWEFLGEMANVAQLTGTVTGTMSQYTPLLITIAMSSLLYVQCMLHLIVNLNPLCKPSDVSYTLISTVAYFEFLPVHRNNGAPNSISFPKSLNEKEQQELVDLTNVKLGQEYELVVTTYTRLYEYKVEDMLRVAGFKNKSPQFNFLCKKMLHVDWDWQFAQHLKLWMYRVFLGREKYAFLRK